MLISISTGRVYAPGTDAGGDPGPLMPVLEGEPYFAQYVGSGDTDAPARTDDGRFDRSHLSPEHAYRIGRDFIAHAVRYGYPMKIVKERVGAGARILELGCGKELPFFRTLVMDHSATRFYKPTRYVGVDLNKVRYNPAVSGIRTTILSGVNVVDSPERVPDEVYDLVVSFEVVEHMGKDDGLKFISRLAHHARSRFTAEGKPGLLLMSTPVNGGQIARNHVYEWHRGELRRAIEAQAGARIIRESGTFANIRDIVPALSAAERQCWNELSSYHSPNVLAAIFAANHPEVARNVCWLVEVGA